MTENFPDQELFAAGTWNSDEYTIADIDAMVEAAPRVGFRIPVKFGHAENQELPACGYVENLRRVGTKLVGDFMNVPRRVAKIIKQGGVLSKSAEIFWNWQHGATGEKFSRVLRAVALLGASTPAVSGLNSIVELYDRHGHEFKVYRFDFESREENEKMETENISEVVRAYSAGAKWAEREMADIVDDYMKHAGISDRREALHALCRHADFAAGLDSSGLSNFLGGLTHLRDDAGRLDADEVAALMNSDPALVEIARATANTFIGREQLKEITVLQASRGTVPPHAANFASEALRIVRGRYPSVAAIDDGAGISGEALAILAPKFF